MDQLPRAADDADGADYEMWEDDRRRKKRHVFNPQARRLSGIRPASPQLSIGSVLALREGMFKPIAPVGDDPRTYKIIGAAMEVHRVLGAGFLELFYKDALKIEFEERGIPFEAEVPCGIEYKGRPLRGEYHMDFICFGEVVLEIKARSNTGPADHAQVISYLASSKLQIGLLLNFGGDRLDYKRFVRSR